MRHYRARKRTHRQYNLLPNCMKRELGPGGRHQAVHTTDLGPRKLGCHRTERVRVIGIRSVVLIAQNIDIVQGQAADGVVVDGFAAHTCLGEHDCHRVAILEANPCD